MRTLKGSKCSKEGKIQIPSWRKLRRFIPTKSEKLLYSLPAQIALAYEVFSDPLRINSVMAFPSTGVFQVRYFEGMDHDTEYLDVWEETKTRGWVLKSIEIV